MYFLYSQCVSQFMIASGFVFIFCFCCPHLVVLVPFSVNHVLDFHALRIFPYVLFVCRTLVCVAIIGVLSAVVMAPDRGSIFKILLVAYVIEEVQDWRIVCDVLLSVLVFGCVFARANGLCDRLPLCAFCMSMCTFYAVFELARSPFCVSRMVWRVVYIPCILPTCLFFPLSANSPRVYFGYIYRRVVPSVSVSMAACNAYIRAVRITAFRNCVRIALLITLLREMFLQRRCQVFFAHLSVFVAYKLFCISRGCIPQVFVSLSRCLP